MTTSGKAITGFVFSLVTPLVPLFGVLFAIAALIFSYLGLKEMRDGARKGRGFALAGLVIGCFALLLTILSFIGMLAYFGVVEI